MRRLNSTARSGVPTASIEEKKYAEQFASDKRRLFKIGVSFSTKERGIAEWKAVGG